MSTHPDTPEDRARRYEWTQPQCENCFRRDNPEKHPVRLLPHLRENERCVTCGIWSQDGIYIRIDPRTAPYPSRLKGVTPRGEDTESY